MGAEGNNLMRFDSAAGVEEQHREAFAFGVEIGVGAIEICLFLISISILNNDKEMDSIYVKKIVALLMMCAFLITIKISGIFFALLVPVIISPMIYEVFKKFPSIFKNFIGNDFFTRQDYLRHNKEISTATASRDLKEAVDNDIIEKIGEKRLTKYRYKKN